MSRCVSATRARAIATASTSSRMFLIGTSRVTAITTRLPVEMKLLAQPRAVGTESLGVDTLRHPRDRSAEFAGQLLRRPAVGDQRVGPLQIPRVSGIGLARQVDDDGDVADPEPRRLMEGVRMHEVGRLRARGDPPPRRAAEPLFVGMQRRHRQTSEAAAMLMAVDKVARVGRSQQRDVERVDRIARAAEQQRTSGDDLDAHAQRRQLARPGQVARLAAASHHREAADQHRHAHARSRLPARSTCCRAHSSRHTSAQIRFAWSRAPASC